LPKYTRFDHLSFIFVICFSSFFLAFPVWSDSLGSRWDGRENKDCDFTLFRSDPSVPNFEYQSVCRSNGQKIHGKVSIDFFNGRVKVKKQANGKETICDGIISGDSKFVSGVCYADEHKYFWWATITQHSPGSRPQRVNLNTATVAELESYLGLDGRTARNIIEAKLVHESFSDPEDLLDYEVVPEDVFFKIQPMITTQ
jgi:hypothetical protein